MANSSEVRVLFLLVCATIFVPGALAQNNRTAVSVSGNDAAACTVPDPCRTFSVALSKTNPNGEVVALTSGGYGPFTVDRPATIVAARGIYAALVATTGNAILVDAGAGAKVVIRGLHVYGTGTGSAGINVGVNSEETHIENCVVDGFNWGIIALSNIRVSDTTVRRCTNGIQVTNAPAVVKGTINRVEVRDMSGNGVASLTDANVTVRDSVAADCNVGFLASGGQLNIENGLATNSVVGVQASIGGTVRVSNTMATDNNIGFRNHPLDPGTFVSWGNNKVQGNITNKEGTITVVGQD